MAGSYLHDLKDPAKSWKGTAYSYFPNGSVSSKVGSIIDPAGPRRMYWVLDTVMYQVPEGTDIDRVHMSHYHERGYETFFVDSGRLYLFINGQKALAQKGDIVHLAAGQAHGMAFLEDVKWRGTYHDYDVPDAVGEVANVIAHVPEAKDDPELLALNPGMDNTKLEPFVFQEVPTEQCLAIKNPARPWASYAFPGCTMKVLVERWENGGAKELCLAELEPGFTAQWVKYPKLRELYYVRSGKIRFRVMDEEFLADNECVVDIPRFAPHSIEVLERAELYDLGGQTHWSLFLQSLESIRRNDPARLEDPAAMQSLREKFGVGVASIGFAR